VSGRDGRGPDDERNLSMATVDGQPAAGGAPELPARAGSREWLALAVLCLPTMLAAVDINVMFLALPHLSAELGSGSTQQLWITDIYGFMITGFLVTMGTLGDRVGRRRVLLFGAAAFILVSLVAAFSTSTTMLIIARALLGVAGATVMPSVLALIRTMFKDPKQMGAAMGVWGTSIMGGIVLGPVVGGLLLGAFWWGSIFLMAVPVMGLLLVAGPFLVPESRNPHAGRLDLFSVMLSLGAILPLIYGLKELARGGWGGLPIVAVLAGAIFMALFIRRQRRLTYPLLDLSLFRDRALSVASLLALSSPFVAGGVTLTATLYMQMVRGLTPFQVGLWLLIPSVVMIVAGNAAPAVARKVPPGRVLAGAAVIAVVGMLVLTQVSSTGSLAPVLTGLAIAYIGGGAMGILSATLIMWFAPPEKAGSAGSLSASFGEFGTALGVALLGLIGTVVYRAQVTVPEGVPDPAADTARESISGAVAVSQHAPDPAALLGSAREAFTSGFNTVAGIAAVCFVGLFILAIIGLRRVPATGVMLTPGMPPGPDAPPPPGAASADEPEATVHAGG
jgi:DHA2 family multidrug resistance protein-like MFS transporter